MDKRDLPPLPWLVADIGGTNVRFALVTEAGQPPLAERILRCADFPDLESAIESYLQQADMGRPKAAVMAIAGPVTRDEIRMTNHPWAFSQSALCRRLGLARLLMLNDFTALALALPQLGPSDLHQVGPGQPVANAPLALIGPGTGLGVSGLLPIAGGWQPLAGEGGHVTLAPANARESAILDVVRRSYPHISAERLLSGTGLPNLYRAIAELDGKRPEGLTPAEISERALAGDDPLCVDTLNTFCAMLGTTASNLVLTLGALGGLFIGGGIVPRLGEFFDHSPFRHSFTAKGRFTDYLALVPSYVIVASTPALLGAARAFVDLPENPGG